MKFAENEIGIMTSGQKVALSLLLSVLVSCAFTIVAFSGLFDVIEVNFYQPVVKELKEQKLKDIADAQNDYLETLIQRFDSFLRDASVKSYVESRPQDSVVQQREKLRGDLATYTGALTGIRIVDDNGRNVYYSTFPTDVISSKKGITYRNYDASGDVAFASVKSSEWLSPGSAASEKCRIIKDGEQNRLIFSLPFYDRENVFRGSALFYCDAAHFSRFLFNRNLVDISGFGSLVTAKRDSRNLLSGFGGFVFGLPHFGENSAEAQILEKWRDSPTESFWRLVPVEKSSVSEPVPNPAELRADMLEDAATAGETQKFCVFSYKNARDDFGFIALIYNEAELQFPQYLRMLLLATAFITFYLAIFLILSFRHDDIVVIRDKIQRYENEFLIGYKKLGDVQGSDYFTNQRAIVEKRIIQSLGKKAVKHAAEFEAMFDSSWNELLASVGVTQPVVQIASAHGTPPANAKIDAEELKEIVKSSLEDILESGKLKINAVPVAPDVEQVSVESEKTEPAEEAAVVEEVGEASEAESLEEIEDASPLEERAEANEEEALDELEDAELIEEIEPLPDSETVEGREPLSETEELAELEEIEDAEPVETLEELPESEERADFEEIEETEPVSDIDTVESLSDSELTSMDEEGLAREPSIAEQYDIMRLKETHRTMGELDEGLEELEVLTPDEKIEKFGAANATDFVPHLLDSNIASDDDLYKDEVLLEKIEFGVPTAESECETCENPLIDNFTAVPPDYSFLDDDELDEMYKTEQSEPAESNEHYFENPYVLTEGESDEETPAPIEEIAEESVEVLDEPEEIAEPEEILEELEETVENEAEPADEIQELESITELESLEPSEENMPFSFTQIASSNATVTELAPELPDSIIENSDGTFCIAQNPSYETNQTLDLEFKKLVDSILR